MTYCTKPRTGSKNMAPHKKRSRHRHIRLPENIICKWNLIAFTRGQETREAFEQAVKDMELLYACVADGEVTTLIHKNEVVTPLTPVFLVSKTLLPILDGVCTVNTRIQVSPDAYSRAQNVSRYTKLPMNIVFSLAIHIDILLSDPSVKEVKISRHPSFLPPDFF